MLTKEHILAISDVKIEKVEVPEWGGHVYVRSMTASHRDEFESEQLKHPNVDIRARMAVYCLCDEAGNLLFTPTDIKVLGTKSAAALDHIFFKAVEMSRVSQDDIETLKKT